MNDLSNWNVIIVDDEPDNIGVMQLVLEFHNASVRVADSGKKCLQIIEEERPSVMLVDIQMPEMSGYELLEKIQEINHLKHVPIIAVTAHAMRDDDRRILSAGFDGYIPKPVNVTTLIQEVQKIVTAKGKIH